MTKDCDNKDPPKPPSDPCESSKKDKAKKEDSSFKKICETKKDETKPPKVVFDPHEHSTKKSKKLDLDNPCDSSKKDKVEKADISLSKICEAKKDGTKPPKPTFDPHEHSSKKPSVVCGSSAKDKPAKIDPCAPKIPEPICKTSAAPKVDPCAPKKPTDICGSSAKDKPAKIDPCAPKIPEPICKTSTAPKVDPCAPKKPTDVCGSSTKDKPEKIDPCVPKIPEPKVDPCAPKKPTDVCGSSAKDKPEKTDPRASKIPEPICKTSEKTSSKAAAEVDPCAKYYPKGLDEFLKKKPKSTTTSASTSTTTSTSTSKSTIPESCKISTSTEEKVKPKSTEQKPTERPKKAASLLNIKKKVPVINLQGLKKIEYGKLLLYSYCKISTWIRNRCNPKKMADKGSGAPARPMKYPYTFSAKFAQFPMGHYVKNQWIWKYYVVAFAACVPIFYSINKLANSPGNVAKWAEIRRKEAAAHHH